MFNSPGIRIARPVLYDCRGAKGIGWPGGLSGDPLATIANTRRIEAVILNGRIYHKPELQRMLRWSY